MLELRACLSHVCRFLDQGTAIRQNQNGFVIKSWQVREVTPWSVERINSLICLRGSWLLNQKMRWLAWVGSPKPQSGLLSQEFLWFCCRRSLSLRFGLIAAMQVPDSGVSFVGSRCVHCRSGMATVDDGLPQLKWDQRECCAKGGTLR